MRNRSQKEFAKPSFKIEKGFPSFTPAVPVLQPVHFVRTKLTIFVVTFSCNYLNFTETHWSGQNGPACSQLPTKHCPLKDGNHSIWMCTKFKQQGVIERYETLKKFKLYFCCLNSHLMKECKSDIVCAVK